MAEDKRKLDVDFKAQHQAFAFIRWDLAKCQTDIETGIKTLEQFDEIYYNHQEYAKKLELLLASLAENFLLDENGQRIDFRNPLTLGQRVDMVQQNLDQLGEDLC
jgi:hypothetical protein